MSLCEHAAFFRKKCVNASSIRPQLAKYFNKVSGAAANIKNSCTPARLEPDDCFHLSPASPDVRHQARGQQVSAVKSQPCPVRSLGVKAVIVVRIVSSKVLGRIRQMNRFASTALPVVKASPQTEHHFPCFMDFSPGRTTEGACHGGRHI